MGMGKKSGIWGALLWIKENWGWFITILFLVGIVLYGLVTKDEFILANNDTLDSNIANLRVTYLKRIGEIAWDSKPLALGGNESAERLFVFSFSLAFELLHLLYFLFDAYIAFYICFILRIVFSVFGFVFLFQSLFDKDFYNTNRNLIVFGGLLYGILPYWPMSFGISVFPLLFALLAKIYKEGKWWQYIVLLAIIKTAGLGLALFGCFILGAVLVFLVFDAILNRKINKHILLAFLIVIAYYIVTEYSLIVSTASGSNVRTMRAGVIYEPDIAGIFKDIFQRLYEGRYHVGTNQRAFLAPFCFGSFIIVNVLAVFKRKLFEKKTFILFNIFYCCYLLCGIVAGISANNYGFQLITTVFPFLGGISLDRFSWFNPMLLLLCFTIIVIEMKRKGRYFPIALFSTALTLSIMLAEYDGYTIQYDIIGANIRYALGDQYANGRDTWHGYVSEDLFDQIKSDLDYKDEFCLAFGFLPSILNFNGMYTLDGYDSGCSKEYYDEFTKLIKPYLEQGTQWVDYYVNDGIRLYAYGDGIPWSCPKINPYSEQQLLIDADQFVKMGGKYIISINIISNAEELGIELLHDYRSYTSAYQEVYVYGLK